MVATTLAVALAGCMNFQTRRLPGTSLPTPHPLSTLTTLPPTTSPVKTEAPTPTPWPTQMPLTNSTRLWTPLPATPQPGCTKVYLELMWAKEDDREIVKTEREIRDFKGDSLTWRVYHVRAKKPFSVTFSVGGFTPDCKKPITVQVSVADITRTFSLSENGLLIMDNLVINEVINLGRVYGNWFNAVFFSNKVSLEEYWTYGQYEFGILHVDGPETPAPTPIPTPTPVPPLSPGGSLTRMYVLDGGTKIRIKDLLTSHFISLDSLLTYQQIVGGIKNWQYGLGLIGTHTLWKAPSEQIQYDAPNELADLEVPKNGTATFMIGAFDGSSWVGRFNPVGLQAGTEYFTPGTPEQGYLLKSIDGRIVKP